MNAKQMELADKLEGLKRFQAEQESILKVSLFILTTSEIYETTFVLGRAE